MTDHLQEAKDILRTSIDPKCEKESIAHSLIAIAEEQKIANGFAAQQGTRTAELSGRISELLWANNRIYTKVAEQLDEHNTLMHFLVEGDCPNCRQEDSHD